MFDDRWGKQVALVVLPLTVLMFCTMAIEHFSYTPDDTYIYLRFANNFIHGHGLSFNADEPTYGFTSPLWMCIVSLGGGLGVDVYFAAKAIDIFFACLTIVVLYVLSAEVVRDHVVALLSALAFSLNVWQIRWAGSGMETSLAALLVVASLLFCLRNEYLLAAVLVALLTLVRPEGCILLVLILGDLYVNSANRRHAARMAVAMIGTYALLLLPWFLYAYHAFGTIIPNTFYAKSSVTFGVADYMREFLNSVKSIAASDGLSIVVLLASAVIVFRTPSSDDTEDVQKTEKFYLFRQCLAGMLWIAVILVLYCVLRVPVVSRYFLVMTPLITVFAFAFLFQAVNKSMFSRYRYAAVFVFTGFLFLQSQIVYRRIVRPGVEAFAQGMATTLVPIGSWLKENSAPDDVVMAWDIGAVGYFSDRKICDAAGLITPGMIALTREGFTYNQIIEKKLYKPYCDVRYIVHRSEKPEEFGSERGLFPLLTRPFYRLGLMRTDVAYYTLYKVVSDTLKSDSKVQSP